MEGTERCHFLRGVSTKARHWGAKIERHGGRQQKTLFISLLAMWGAKSGRMEGKEGPY